MKASLGNIQFDVVKGFNSFSETKEAAYAEHAIIDGKPRLQRIGDALDKVSLGIRFHPEFCNPETELQQLYEAQANGDILALILGNGRVIGEYVIQSNNINYTKTDGIGNIIDCQVSVELTEYYDEDRESRAQDLARSNGFALAENEPQVSINTTSTPSTPSKMGDSMKSAGAAAGGLDSKVKQIASGITPTEYDWDDLRKNANTARVKLQEVETLLGTGDYSTRFGDLVTATDQSITKLGNLETAINNKDVLQLPGTLQEFKSAHNTFKSEFSAVSALISTKNT